MAIKEGSSDNQNVAIGFVLGNDPDTENVNISSLNLSNDSLAQKSLNLINLIVDNNQDPQTAASSLNLPVLTTVTYDFIKIIKQSPLDKRDYLKEKLANVNVCSFSLGILDLLQKIDFSTNFSSSVFSRSGSGTYTVSGGRTIEQSKTEKSNVESITNSVNSFISTIQKEMAKNILNSELPNINSSDSPEEKILATKSYCSKLIKETNEEFVKQDTENRKKAAGLTKD